MLIIAVLSCGMAGLNNNSMRTIKTKPIGEQEYEDLLHQAVVILGQSRKRLAVEMNSVVSNAYWELGRLLEMRKIDSMHGASVVKRLSFDLKTRYPGMGFSPRNLWDMKRFYHRYSQADEKLRRTVALLPWSHNILMIQKGLPDKQVLFYAQEIITKGWSKDMLLHAIQSDYYSSLASTVVTNNFASTLPPPAAAYANEVFRSKYNLGFIDSELKLNEWSLERRLVSKVTRLIMELGKGFCFIGNQYILPLNGKEFKVDMLFFHRHLHRMVAIDLKVGEFKPEYVGKMNFYLTLLDRREKTPEEGTSIGIILCAEKDGLQVEVALQDVNKPIGVAEYQYLLPKDDIQQLISAEMRKTR